MKNNWKLIIGILGFMILLGGSYALYQKLSTQYGKEDNISELPQETMKEETKEDERLEAYDFTVYDEEGNRVKLSSFYGKPIVLNFWASWCGPCKSEMPEFQKAYETYGDKINFLMVNMTDEHQETQANAKKYVKDKKYTFPVFYDLNEEAAFIYQVSALPTTYFINKDGFVVSYVYGALTKQGLLKRLDELIN